MRPYYADDLVTIYHGDCRDVLPYTTADVVLTDPPYKRDDYPWQYVPIDTLGIALPGYWFWPPHDPFPLEWSARHIWSKCNVLVGDMEPYECIYQIGGSGFCGVFRYAVINCLMNAQMNRDTYLSHPTQKPIRLISRLVRRSEGIIVDPFAGTGTTLKAAKEQGRRSIGIEIEERYCEIAAERCRQEVLSLGVA